MDQIASDWCLPISDKYGGISNQEYTEKYNAFQEKAKRQGMFESFMEIQNKLDNIEKEQKFADFCDTLFNKYPDMNYDTLKSEMAPFMPHG